MNIVAKTTTTEAMAMEMTSSMRVKPRPRLAWRILKWVGLSILGFILFSLLWVLLYRFVPPPFTFTMAGDLLGQYVQRLRTEIGTKINTQALGRALGTITDQPISTTCENTLTVPSKTFRPRPGSPAAGRTGRSTGASCGLRAERRRPVGEA